MMNNAADGEQVAYRKVKKNINSADNTITDNDDEVDILGDMASQED